MCGMRCTSLRGFLDHLDDVGQLTRVAVEVSADLEIAEITRRVAAAGGPALLFTNILDSQFSLATNVLGTRRRVELSLDAESIDEVADRFAVNIRQQKAVSPRAVTTAACQQVVQLGRDIQLDALPWLRLDVDRPAPELPGALVVTRDPDTEQIALGHYQLTVVERRVLAIRWSDRDPIARHFAAFCRRDERMPVAVFVGGPPRLSLVTRSHGNHQLSAYELASCLDGKPIDVVDCRTIPLPVPAEAELIVEGYLDPVQPQSLGPGDAESGAGEACHDRGAVADGSFPSDALALEVGMVTHRTEPLLAAEVTGDPPDETGTIALCGSRLELPWLKHRHPAIVDLVRPVSAPLRYTFVAINKDYAEQPRELAAALWGEASLRDVRYIILVDEAVKLEDEQQVWRQVGLHAEPDRDVLSPPTNLRGERASSIVIDATRKLAAGRSAGVCSADSFQSLREDSEKLEEIRQLVSRRWGDYGIP